MPCILWLAVQSALLLAWGTPVNGLRLGLVRLHDPHVLANIAFENTGARPIVVVWTPDLRGCSIRFESLKDRTVARSFDFEQPESLLNKSGIGRSRQHDIAARLQPGERIMLPVEAPRLFSHGIRQLPPGQYRMTASFRWSEGDTASRRLQQATDIARYVGCWTGEVHTGAVEIRLPYAAPKMRRLQ